MGDFKERWDGIMDKLGDLTKELAALSLEEFGPTPFSGEKGTIKLELELLDFPGGKIPPESVLLHHAHLSETREIDGEIRPGPTVWMCVGIVA